MTLYYESHINVKAGDSADIELMTTVAQQNRMKITLMDNHDHLFDSKEKEWVITGHARELPLLEARMKNFITDVRAGMTVTRYKIEKALLDSRIVDEWELL